MYVYKYTYIYTHKQIYVYIYRFKYIFIYTYFYSQPILFNTSTMYRLRLRACIHLSVCVHVYASVLCTHTRIFATVPTLSNGSRRRDT